MKLNYLLSLLVVCCLLLSGTVFSLLFFQTKLQHEEIKRLDFIVSVESSIDVLRGQIIKLTPNSNAVLWREIEKENTAFRLLLTNEEGRYFSKTQIAHLFTAQQAINTLIIQGKTGMPENTADFSSQQKIISKLNQLILSLPKDAFALHYGFFQYLSKNQHPLTLVAAWILVLLSLGVSGLMLLFRYRFKVGLQTIKDAIRDVKWGNFQGVVQGTYDDELRIVAEELSVMKRTLNETMISRDVLKLGLEEQTAQLIKQHDELNLLANIDSLTGALNRRAFDAQVQQSIGISKRVGLNAALLYMDLDDFKGINDTYGHEMGDFVLTEISARLTSGVRETDLVARAGGDEFIVWLDLIESDVDIQAAVWRVINSIDWQIKKGKISLKIRMSVGVAIFPTHSEDLTALMNMADEAMYKAKKMNKNTKKMHICIYDEKDPHA